MPQVSQSSTNDLSLIHKPDPYISQTFGGSRRLNDQPNGERIGEPEIFGGHVLYITSFISCLSVIAAVEHAFLPHIRRSAILGLPHDRSAGARQQPGPTAVRV